MASLDLRLLCKFFSLRVRVFERLIFLSPTVAAIPRGLFWQQQKHRLVYLLTCVLKYPCAKSLIYLVLTNWPQRGVTVTDTVGTATYFGFKAHRSCSSFSAGRVLLSHITNRFLFGFLAHSDLQFSFTSLLPIPENILMVLTFFLLKTFDKLF